MPTSFKTGGRTPAGCAEARIPRANGDRNNTIANARSMIRLPSFDLCSLGTNMSMYLPSPGSAGILACLLRSVSPRGKPSGRLPALPGGFSRVARATTAPSMLLGLNLLRLSRLRLRRLRSRLLGRLLRRLRSRLLGRLLNTNHPPRVRAGDADLSPNRLGLLHLFGDRGRRKHGQSLLGDHFFRAANRDMRDPARLIYPAITVEYFVRLLAKILHRFEREVGRLICGRGRIPPGSALQQRHRTWRQFAVLRFDLGRVLLLLRLVELPESPIHPFDYEKDERRGDEQNGQK